MAFSAYSEQHILDQMFGPTVCTVNATINAGTAGVTSITVAGIGATVPPLLANGNIIILSWGTINAEAFTLSATPAANATTLSVTSQTSAKAHAVGDAVVVMSQIVAPANVFFALSTGTASAAVVEPVGSAYARVQVANTFANFPASTGSAPATKNNANVITFPTATGAWGTIQSIAIYDASSSGNLIGQANLTTNQVINNGDTASFNASTLGITVN